MRQGTKPPSVEVRAGLYHGAGMIGIGQDADLRTCTEVERELPCMMETGTQQCCLLIADRRTCLIAYAVEIKCNGTFPHLWKLHAIVACRPYQRTAPVTILQVVQPTRCSIGRMGGDSSVGQCTQKVVSKSAKEKFAVHPVQHTALRKIA